MKDKYSQACDYFDAIENEEEFKKAVRSAWYRPEAEGPSCLFQFLSPSGAYGSSNHTSPDGKSIGCLMMVRLGSHHAWTPELTESIRGDKRIPISIADITKSKLRRVIAPWQRKIDKILGRS